MTVSIIIPLHNGEAYIKETLESCFQQTHSDIEVIVVENGSHDNSLQIAKAAKDSRLKVYQTSKANASAARNYGYQKSTGDYVMFLDADDVLASHKIELQLKALEQMPTDWLASCVWAKFNDVISDAQEEDQAVWRIQQP